MLVNTFLKRYRAVLFGLLFVFGSPLFAAINPSNPLTNNTFVTSSSYSYDENGNLNSMTTSSYDENGNLDFVINITFSEPGTYPQYTNIDNDGSIDSDSSTVAYIWTITVKDKFSDTITYTWSIDFSDSGNTNWAIDNFGFHNVNTEVNFIACNNIHRAGKKLISSQLWKTVTVTGNKPVTNDSDHNAASRNLSFINTPSSLWKNIMSDTTTHDNNHRDINNLKLNQVRNLSMETRMKDIAINSNNHREFFRTSNRKRGISLWKHVHPIMTLKVSRTLFKKCQHCGCPVRQDEKLLSWV